MIGIGIFTHALNILPFAYFLIAPFTNGRNNMPGNRTVPFHAYYYRQYWQRFLFGKHLIVTAPIFITIKVIEKYKVNKNDEQRVWDIFAISESLGVDYDEESCKEARIAINDFKESQLIRSSLIKFSTERAEFNHKKKSEVFDDYISKQEVL